MSNTRLLIALLAPRRSASRRQQGGFALALSLFVGLSVILGWLVLANRSTSSRLGAALQNENREARLAAESGMETVFNELNRPRNRMLLAQGTSLGAWQAAGNGSPDRRYINPCRNAGDQPPSSQVAAFGRSDAISLPGGTGVGDRLTRRFRVVGVDLRNADRSSGGNYNAGLINLSPPSSLNPRRGVGYAQVVVRGEVLRQGQTVATAEVSREYQVVPKCCDRSFRGPGDTSKPVDGPTGQRPGLYGDDNRYCNEDFPKLLVGTANNATNNAGGVYTLLSSTPEIRNQDDPDYRPPEILCYTEKKSCDQGLADVDRVPVKASNRKVQQVPILSTDGIPCDDDDVTCIRDGLKKSQSGGFSARAIDLYNDSSNGAKNNSATNANAKDYIRVNANNQVEICNKTYTQRPFLGGGTPEQILARNEKRLKEYDRTPTIVPDSCEPMMGTGNPTKDVCAEQVIDGFRSYHCRISHIYVNDFGATSDLNIEQNNTLFIDSSRGPIYLYINEDWAMMGNRVITKRIDSFGGFDDDPPSNYQPVYTVGGYNDGQIQHVYCGPRNGRSPQDGTNACVEAAPVNISTRAAIVSACSRRYDDKSAQVVEECQGSGGTSKVNALLGDDGFARGLFVFMPNSTLKIAGDPLVTDIGGDKPQGKPQVAAAVWVNNLEFVRKTVELYVPGRDAEFFGLETSYNDRYTPKFSFDYVARSVAGTSLFNF